MRALLATLVVLFFTLGLSFADDAPVTPAENAPEADQPLLGPGPKFVEPTQAGATKQEPSFQWHSAMKQSIYFLAIQHSFRIATEADTRAQLKGPFFRDWIDSIKGYSRWKDGDPAFVNYVGHPMMGAVSGSIFLQNSRDAKGLTFGSSSAYWRTRAQAAMFSAVYSAFFELGPVSESSLGNVGHDPHPSGVVDLVVTPTIGTGWLIAEDILDRYVIAKLETKIKNRPAKIFLRGFLNPSRSFASMLAGHAPWIRYDRGGVWRRP